MININTPLKAEDISKLKTGDMVKLSGIIYTARDAAHKKIVELIENGENLPFELTGAVIYYVGPTPEKPDQIIGSAGPTTSGRMDSYSSLLMDNGLRGMIGKGARNNEVKESIKKNKAVYFAAVGGAAALIAKSIKSSEIVAYEELGTEAVRKLEVVDFPVIVINDIYGNDLYEEGQKEYRSL
ncbi:MAG: Fe-S-containing hydro-lyase [Sebaldella sp.]|nr:Fe-S-containing hydro-lyase [Sebaldella sp.]